MKAHTDFSGTAFQTGARATGKLPIIYSIPLYSGFIDPDMTCPLIFLTPRVLGYCGFKHKFGDWIIHIETEGLDESMPLLRYKCKDGCWYLKENKISIQPSYLHQLQKLFIGLTKKQLEVNPHLFGMNDKTILPPYKDIHLFHA